MRRPALKKSCWASMSCWKGCWRMSRQRQPDAKKPRWKPQAWMTMCETRMNPASCWTAAPLWSWIVRHPSPARHWPKMRWRQQMSHWRLSRSYSRSGPCRIACPASFFLNRWRWHWNYRQKCLWNPFFQCCPRFPEQMQTKQHLRLQLEEPPNEAIDLKEMRT